MKKSIVLSLLMLIFSSGFFAQSANDFTDDEIARIKFSVHLITYDTVSKFDSPQGEAYYTMVINAFKENLTFPQFNASQITVHDKTKTEKYIQLLNQTKQNPPSWEELFRRQTEYLIWRDKALRKKSKYRNE